MSLSLEQAQWLVQFMQNLPGADREYEDATHAQRVQAAHGLNVQQHMPPPEHAGYGQDVEGGFEAGGFEAPFYGDGYDSGYESY